jgi:hypothetical protein
VSGTSSIRPEILRENTKFKNLSKDKTHDSDKMEIFGGEFFKKVSILSGRSHTFFCQPPVLCVYLQAITTR